MNDESNGAQAQIIEVCDAIKRLLCEKNTNYGNSALKGVGVFCKDGASSSILQRLDDKLGRVKNRKTKDVDPELIFDLIGYLVLYLISLEVNLDDVVKAK